MALNKESNGYIIGFATIMVVVVGALLAFIAMSLKPIQNENVQNEKKQYILKAIDVNVERAAASKAFDEYVTKRVILSYDGKIISEKTGAINKTDLEDAFNINLLKEYKTLPVEERNYPLFVCEKDGEEFYVIPTMGTGLWAAVWGYIGFEKDFNTIYDAVFDHKSETPGLGSEIATDMFADQFKGKTIAEGGSYTSIEVVKPGAPLNNHKVDGISGGTFTSVGVDEMIRRTAKVYYDYFQNNQSI